MRDFATGTAIGQRPARSGLGAAAAADAPEAQGYENLKIVDDRKKEVKPQVDMESDEVVVRPENPSAEINLNLAAPERDAKKLGLAQGQGRAHDSGGHQDVQVSQPGPEERDSQAGRRQPDARGHRGRRAGLEGQRRRWRTRAKARPSRAIARACSTTGSGSSALTARDSSTTAGSRTPAPTAASSASNTSSSTPRESRRTTSSSTRPRAR